jgi:hypothetical protein
LAQRYLKQGIAKTSVIHITLKMFPYINYNIDNIGLLFRVWFSSTMRPLEHIGHTGDIFICERFETVYWKKPFSNESEERWCLAKDDKIIIHPCEPHLRLTVVESVDDHLYIAWQTSEAGKCGDFKNTCAAMKDDSLEHCCELGRTENPIQID